MRSFIIEKSQAGQRFDKYLKRILPMAQSSLLYKSLRKKNITLNGKKAEGKEILKAGDEVKIFFSDETFEKFAETTDSSKWDKELQNACKIYEAYRKKIAIAYQDENILIPDKPVGLLSQKSKPEDASVNEWLLGYLYSENALKTQDLSLFKPAVCNRLDRNTSGLVLCGKTLHGSQALSKALKERTVDKYYLTYVQGKLCTEITHTAFLVKHERTNKVQVFSALDEAERTLEMEQKVSKITTKVLPVSYDEKRNITKLEILLITGKSHQIRAHLSYLGYPILGDVKYGYKKEENDLEIKNFQMLHAYKVHFSDAFELENLRNETVCSALPESFQRLEKQLCLRGIPED